MSKLSTPRAVVQIIITATYDITLLKLTRGALLLSLLVLLSLSSRRWGTLTVKHFPPPGGVKPYIVSFVSLLFSIPTVKLLSISIVRVISLSVSTLLGLPTLSV